MFCDTVSCQANGVGSLWDGKQTVYSLKKSDKKVEMEEHVRGKFSEVNEVSDACWGGVRVLTLPCLLVVGAKLRPLQPLAQKRKKMQS